MAKLVKRWVKWSRVDHLSDRERYLLDNPGAAIKIRLLSAPMQMEKDSIVAVIT
jgi:hypothetical protein